MEVQMRTQLQGCKSLAQLKPILSRFMVNGLLRRAVSLCKLVEFLALSKNTQFLFYARLLVDVQFTHLIPGKHLTFLCNNLIKGYSHSQFPEQAFLTYARMLQKSSKPDNFTFPFVVKASASRHYSVIEGEQVHGQIVKHGFESDIFVVNTLLNMYCVFGELRAAQTLFCVCPCLDVISWNTLLDGYVKYGSLELARKLFDQMPERNDISWTAMISGYTNCGELDVAQSLFDKMPVKRSTVTWNSMILGFARCGFLSLARKLFDEMPSRNIVSWNTMISAYAQSGELDLARCLFDKMLEKDVYSWSGMISGYVQWDRARDALELFKQMHAENNSKPNEVTLMSVLSACGQMSELDQGKWIHAYIESDGMKLTGNLGAALIDMYAKCGCMETAYEVFWKLDRKNVSSWNALITGLAINGDAHGALQSFLEMQKSEIKPNDVTYLGVLMACCHGGLVSEGRRHFNNMSKVYGIKPQLKHYGCMVDLLGRAGLLEEAEGIVRHMPVKPDAMVLGALLGACRIHGNVRIADTLRKDFLEQKSDESGCHILLSNIYSAVGRWSDASDMRTLLKINRIKKNTGSSSILGA